MNDWRDKLAGLNQELQAQEHAEQEQKASVLKGFRKRLDELKPVLENAAAFGDAFGVECQWEINRFHDRYPFLHLTIKKPALDYRVECRDGVLLEVLRQGGGAPKLTETTLQKLTPKQVELRVTGWVQAAADAVRTVPWKRK